MKHRQTEIARQMEILTSDFLRQRIGLRHVVRVKIPTLYDYME
jgi:hypothetical protein